MHCRDARSRTCQMRRDSRKDAGAWHKSGAEENCKLLGIVYEVSSRSLFALVMRREFYTLNTNEGLLREAADPGSPSLNVDPCSGSVFNH